ncbi:MAG: ABC transporter ATP-binding protein [Clostridia bacterium]|nr:ABC transporter ATP-binding protein [Clostridia bacterium]
MKEFIKNLKFAWIYTKKQKMKLLFFLILNAITVGVGVVLPILTAKQLVELTNNELEQVAIITLVILGIEWSRNVINYIARIFTQIIYRESFKEIQVDLGAKILKIENECLDQNSSGVFIQRLTGDSSKLADIFNILNNQLTKIVTNIGIFGAIFVINKIAFIYVLIMLGILFLIEHKRLRKRDVNDKKVRDKNEKVVGFVGELVRGVRDIKMLNAEESFMRELSSKIIDMNNERYNFQRVDKRYQFLRGMVIDIFDAGMIFLLIYLIYTQNIEIAVAIVVYNYIGKVTNIVDSICMLLEQIEDFNISAERIFKIINSNEFPKEKFGNKQIEKVKGNFEFKDVSFAYGEKKVLKNISFKVKSKETVAFVGKSGAGKTTIFNLLCKMYNVDDGKIIIDGINIKELDKESIRGNITIISQNPYIFNLSIRDNLRLVKEDLTEEEMIEACKLACIHDFIESLPEGYDTIVGEGGITLSGGQRQRLAIARAFVQKTEIILLDEATSALDNETQYQIQKAIENLQKEYTILIVAHRLSTIINSDRILFLNDGKIEMEGTHEELMENSENYRILYEKEISEKEKNEEIISKKE